MGINLVPPEDIRSEPITFPIAIIKALDRIHFVAYDAVASSDWHKWQGLESSIRIMHAFVAPYYDPDYKAKADAIKAKLKDTKKLYEKNYEYIIALTEWVEAIIEKFALVGLLPARKVKFDWETRKEVDE